MKSFCRVYKLIWIISVISAILLSMPYSSNGLIIGSILTLVSVFFIHRFPAFANSSDLHLHKSDLIILIAADIYLICAFYYRYCDFGFFQTLSSYTDFPSFLLVICIAGILAVLSLPFFTSFISNFHSCSDSGLDAILTSKKCHHFLVYAGFILGSIGLLSLIVSCFSYDIWVDEAFSIALSHHSYSEIIHLTGQDVHPPLYYFWLKFIITILHNFFGMPEIFAAKLSSVIPMIILFLSGITVIRRKYGTDIASLFCACIISMPQLENYGVEIRMYSLALLFVTLSGLCCLIYFRDKNILYLSGMTVFSILAAYTHYFGAIAVSILFMILLAHYLRLKEIKNLLSVIISVIICCVAYLPWLPLLLNQFSAVRSDYWISPITFHTVINYITFVFGYYTLFPVFILMISTFVLYNKKHSAARKPFLISISPLLWILFVGVTVSFATRPVLIDRYFIPALGLFWFGMILTLISFDKKSMRYYLTISIMCIALINIYSFSSNELSFMKRGAKLYQSINSLPKDSVILSSNGHISGILAAMNPDCTITDINKESDLMLKVYTNMECQSSTSVVPTFARSNTPVFFYGNNDAFLDQLKTDGYSYTKVDSFYAESGFYLYRIQSDN
jgi:hypothetical protein